MKHTVSHTTAQALKAAGFPQSDFSDRQTWYDNEGLVFTVLNCERRFKLIGGALGTQFWWAGKGSNMIQGVPLIFSPTLEDITPHLPPTFALEIWGGHQSCANRDEGNPLRTLGENFAEAAAEMWLKIQKREL